MADQAETEFRLPQAEGQRTLAAIVFTDAVNFSQFMNADEEKALGLLREDTNRMHAICVSHGGSVLKFTGDGLLMYFQSAVQAVTCALKIQNTQAEIFKITPEENCMRHRIGIHLGDVIVSDGDVLGDGVNIAARLQHEAKAGGICISQTVYDVVKNKIELKAKFLGPRELKNISESVPAYELFIGHGAQDTAEPMDNDEAQEPIPHFPEQPVTTPPFSQQAAEEKATPGSVFSLLGALAAAVILLITILGVFKYKNNPGEEIIAPIAPPANTASDTSRAALLDNLPLPPTPAPAAVQTPAQPAPAPEAATPPANTANPLATRQELDTLLNEIEALKATRVPGATTQPAPTGRQGLPPAQPIDRTPVTAPAQTSNAEAPGPLPAIAPTGPVISALPEELTLLDDLKQRRDPEYELSLTNRRNLQLMGNWLKSSMTAYNEDKPLGLFWTTTTGNVAINTWASADGKIYVRALDRTDIFDFETMPPVNTGELVYAVLAHKLRIGGAPTKNILAGIDRLTREYELDVTRERVRELVSRYPAVQRHGVF